MLAEDRIVVHPHNIVLIILILQFKVAKKTEFDACLMLEALLVADDLDGDYSLTLVIVAFECLTETTRAQFVHDFEAIREMVLHHDLIVTSLIIKPEVVSKQRRCLDLCRV